MNKNKIHWTRIEHRVGSETTQKLKVLSNYYDETKVSDYFNKTETLIQVGEVISKNKNFIFVTCPNFDNLVAKPQRLMDFENSQLTEILQTIGIPVKKILSSKEYFEHDKRCLREKYSLIEYLQILKTVSRDLEIELMGSAELEKYRQIYLPSDELIRNHRRTLETWSLVSYAQKNDCGIVQMDMYFEKDTFYKKTFGKIPYPVIGYRAKKSY